MLTNANFSGQNLTDFDFHDPATRERLQLWMDLTMHKISVGENLKKPDLLKIAELLKIIQEKSEYKIPRKRGEKKKAEPSFQKLVYYYQAKLEREGSSATEAIEQSASRFAIPFKTAQRYRDTHKKAIDLMIEKFGFDEIAEHYEFHLSLMKDTGRGFKPINFK
jgi:hypothetical protein